MKAQLLNTDGSDIGEKVLVREANSLKGTMSWLAEPLRKPLHKLTLRNQTTNFDWFSKTSTQHLVQTDHRNASDLMDAILISASKSTNSQNDNKDGQNTQTVF